MARDYRSRPHAFGRVAGDSMVNLLGFRQYLRGPLSSLTQMALRKTVRSSARLEDSVEATLKKLVINGPHGTETLYPDID